MQKRIAIVFFFIFLMLVTFLPRVLSLSAHWSSDESTWMKRSHRFISALETGLFTDTFTTHHPGVTTMWLGGAAMWNANDRKSLTNMSVLSILDFFNPALLAQMRFPIAYLTGVVVLLAACILYRLFNAHLAAVGSLFLAFEPFLLAESRRLHTDALTSEFLFLTLLLWLCYLEGAPPRRRYLIFSGFFLGLACLSKSLAGAFILFLPILLVWYIKQKDLSGVKMLWGALLFLCVALLTVLVVWPYMWTFKMGNFWISPTLFFVCIVSLYWIWKRLSVSEETFLNPKALFVISFGVLVVLGASLFVAKNVLAGMYNAFTVAHELPKLFLGDIRYDPGILYYPVMWFVWSGPLTLLLIGAAIYLAWKQQHVDPKVFRVTAVLVCFALFYLLGLSLLAKKIARYIVIFLPSLCLLATIGALQVSESLSMKRWRYLFLVSLVVLQIVPVLRLHPYYQTYYFPLLSGKWVSENVSSITGVGLDLAADYLNAQPNAEKLQVRATLFSRNVNRYFHGSTSVKRGNLPSKQPNALIFDYHVEYLRDKQLQGIAKDSHPKDGVPISALQHDEDIPRALEAVVRLNAVDYVWIYRVLETPGE